MDTFIIRTVFIVFIFGYSSHYIGAKTIMVTGGAGFIGSHVVEKLAQRGDRVLVIDNFADTGHEHSIDYNCMKYDHLQNIIAIYPDLISLHPIDICNQSALDQLCGQHKIDIICHLAARAGVRPSITDPVSYINTNIIGTINILEVAAKYGIPHCVLASSSSVYGNQDHGPFIEDQQTDSPSSIYGASKKSLELIAYVYHHLYNISCTCLRFFTVYGPYGRFDMAPFIFMDAIYHDRPITVYGDGSAVRDFTYVDDIVDGIIRSIDTPCGFEVLNLGCSNPTVLADFIKIIEDTVGKKATITYEPMSAADVLLTHSDVTKAENLLGYEPKVNVEEGIKHMYEWYCMQNWDIH